MRFLLAVATIALALPTSADTIVLSPFSEESWVYDSSSTPPFHQVFGALSLQADLPEPVQFTGSRGVLLFDLGGITRTEIVAISLEIMQISPSLGEPTRIVIEAIPRTGEAGGGLNPWLISTFGPLNLDCVSGECPLFLGEYWDTYNYVDGPPSPTSHDVSGAMTVIDPSTEMLQLNFLLPTAVAPTIRFASSDADFYGFGLPRLVVETQPIPEPSTALLVGLGLTVIGVTRSRRDS